MTALSIKPATRKGIVPLIAMYSESGCGKTYSSLLMARGIAGPDGKIVMIDTESGRGELYADIPVIGGYKVIRLDAPFSPARYIEAIELAETEAAVIVLDSGSHEWEGQNGVLDMAADNEGESKRAGLHNWKKPKFEHALFVAKLLRVKVPIIVCLRAKFKTRQGKDEKGKTIIVKDDTTSPIQAEDFIFESTAHFEILPDHQINLTKCSHPNLRSCFPTEGPIRVEHGQRIAQWCTGSDDAQAIRDAKSRIWNALKAKCGGTKEGVQQHLWDENLMDTGMNLESAPLDILQRIASKL